MLKELVLKLFTYPLCIGLICVSFWLLSAVIDKPLAIDHIKITFVAPLIFLAAFSYLISDITITIKTLRKTETQ